MMIVWPIMIKIYMFVSNHIFTGIYFEFLKVPDIFGVFFDGAIATEMTGS